MDERSKVALSLSKLAIELSVIGLASNDDSRLDMQDPEVEYDALRAFIDRTIQTRETVSRLESLAAKWLDEFLRRHGSQGLELADSEKPYVSIVQEMLRMRQAALEVKLYDKYEDTSDSEKRRFFLSILKKEEERKSSGLKELEPAEKSFEAANNVSHCKFDGKDKRKQLEIRKEILQLEKKQALGRENDTRKLEKASNSDGFRNVGKADGQFSDKLENIPEGEWRTEQKPVEKESLKKDPKQEKYPAEYDSDVDDYWVRPSAEKLYCNEVKYQDGEEDWDYEIDEFKSPEALAVEKVMNWKTDEVKETEVSKRPCWICGKPGVNWPRKCPNKHNHYLYHKSETPKKFNPENQTKAFWDDDDYDGW